MGYIVTFYHTEDLKDITVYLILLSLADEDIFENKISEYSKHFIFENVLNIIINVSVMIVRKAIHLHLQYNDLFFLFIWMLVNFFRVG